jgi:hypothetical protein
MTVQKPHGWISSFMNGVCPIPEDQGAILLVASRMARFVHIRPLPTSPI